jgi:hypothetical protein
MILQLEMASDHQTLSGVVRAIDGSPSPFSGWSELFAVLYRLLADEGGSTETEERLGGITRYHSATGKLLPVKAAASAGLEPIPSLPYVLVRWFSTVRCVTNSA